METVAACADKPRRNFVGVVLLVAGIVERKHVDQLARLIKLVELFAKAIEMFAGVRGGLD